MEMRFLLTFLIIRKLSPTVEVCLQTAVANSDRNGLNMRPNEFKCRITPRSDEIRATIEREGTQALQDLARYMGETKYQMSRFYQQDTLED